jgi:hypothetical protein
MAQKSSSAGKSGDAKPGAKYSESPRQTTREREVSIFLAPGLGQSRPSIPARIAGLEYVSADAAPDDQWVVIDFDGYPPGSSARRVLLEAFFHEMLPESPTGASLPDNLPQSPASDDSDGGVPLPAETPEVPSSNGTAPLTKASLNLLQILLSTSSPSAEASSGDGLPEAPSSPGSTSSSRLLAELEEILGPPPSPSSDGFSCSRSWASGERSPPPSEESSGFGPQHPNESRTRPDQVRDMTAFWQPRVDRERSPIPPLSLVTSLTSGDSASSLPSTRLDPDSPRPLLTFSWEHLPLRPEHEEFSDAETLVADDEDDGYYGEDEYLKHNEDEEDYYNDDEDDADSIS